MHQIFERVGVLLRMEYTPAIDHTGPDIHEIRVLDSHYNPVGPNLLPLFLHMLVITNIKPGQMDVENVVSDLVGELDGSEGLVH